MIYSGMKRFEWNEEKGKELLKIRGVSFEDIVFTLNSDYFLDIVPHPNSKKYAHQKMYVVDIDGYAYLVPFVEKEDYVFLKTIIPSRKATKKYLRK